MSNQVPPSRFDTERLILRPLTEADAEPVFNHWASDPDVARFVCWRPHRNLADTRGYIARTLERWSSGAAYDYGIELRESGTLIGSIAIRISGFQAKLGYNFGQAFWNRGYATETVICLTGWALAQPSIYRVVALHDAENPASGAVLRKAGYVREGLLRRRAVHPNISDEPRDAVQWAKTR